jgi:pimeloyl-ACP methyl ester carboxylesterase
MKVTVQNAVVATGVVLALAAVAARLQTKAAEAAHPPIGKFLNVDGMQLHYLDRGTGDVIVLIHGNGMMIEDFLTSGVIDELSQTHRVIVFDRPGFGYSDRPGFPADWTADRQADVIAKALAQLGIKSADVAGHSIGTQIAIALALNHPDLVRSLIVISGYYFPESRTDVQLMKPLAMPVFGNVYRHTLAPFVARVMTPFALKKLFEPQALSARFDRDFPKLFLSRPIHIGAAAGDASQMTQTASRHSARYHELKMPVAILAGTADDIVDYKANAERLHCTISGSKLTLVPNVGHMVHHADPALIARTIEATPAMAA